MANIIICSNYSTLLPVASLILPSNSVLELLQGVLSPNFMTNNFLIYYASLLALESSQKEADNIWCWNRPHVAILISRRADRYCATIIEHVRRGEDSSCIGERILKINRCRGEKVTTVILYFSALIRGVLTPREWQHQAGFINLMSRVRVPLCCCRFTEVWFLPFRPRRQTCYSDTVIFFCVSTVLLILFNSRPFTDVSNVLSRSTTLVVGRLSINRPHQLAS